MKKSNDSDFSRKKLVLLGSLFVFVLILVISGLYFLGGRVLVSSDQGVTKPTEIVPRIEKGAENFSEIVVDWAQSLGRNPESNQGYKKKEYKNDKFGINLQYPEHLNIKETLDEILDYKGSISFWASSDNLLPDFEVDVFSVEQETTLRQWLEQKNDPVGVLSNMTEFKASNGIWIRGIEAGDPDHVIYAIKENNNIYKLKTTLEEPTYIKDVLQSFK